MSSFFGGGQQEAPTVDPLFAGKRTRRQRFYCRIVCVLCFTSFGVKEKYD